MAFPSRSPFLGGKFPSIIFVALERGALLGVLVKGISPSLYMVEPFKASKQNHVLNWLSIQNPCFWLLKAPKDPRFLGIKCQASEAAGAGFAGDAKAAPEPARGGGGFEVEMSNRHPFVVLFLLPENLEARPSNGEEATFFRNLWTARWVVDCMEV